MKLLDRFATTKVHEALLDTPVVLLHGPRQCGKSTLARMIVSEKNYSYFTFDDEVQREAAQNDPTGFILNLPEYVIIDEVQRVPEIFFPLKSEIDRNRVPGRFVLTGSTNILLLPTLSDSLAGRMEILRLHPFSQDEILGKPSRFLDRVFQADFRSGTGGERLGTNLAERIVSGGFPAAIDRPSYHRRQAWYRDYIETIVQRDVRALARISSLDALPRLLRLAAGQTAHLVNISEMASAFHLSRPTIQDYVTLLERIFLLEHLSPWHTNRLSRLIKSPKLHMTDTGLASALLGATVETLSRDRALYGQMLETFVFQELRKQASWYDVPIGFNHFRTKDGVEVDLVLEGGHSTLVGIEVKSAASVSARDFRALKKLQSASGDRFAAGIVLYDGEHIAPFGEKLYAVPLRMLWEME
ncbi:MAG: ATP-binding protein [Bacteroidetes bacterium]|nr:ATP-binding protein [Bacteroidota bacterium]